MRPKKRVHELHETHETTRSVPVFRLLRQSLYHFNIFHLSFMFKMNAEVKVELMVRKGWHS